MIRLLTLPFRLVVGGVRLGWYAGRTVGPTRAVFFGLGFTAGVWVASPTFRRATLKGAVRAVAAAKRPSDELAPAATTTEPAATTRT
jgi:hypothetical protein